MGKDWQKWALTIMVLLTAYFGSQYLASVSRQNTAQWQANAEVQKCLSGIKERLARLEGYHEAEKQSKGK